MKLRQMATALIYRDGKFVMMKKSKNKLFNFEFWTALGGHMESNEINNPSEACLREVYEESGLRADEIEEFMLRYLLIRQKDNEIRIQYVFFGRTMKTELISSEEGELYWINEDEILEQKISTIIKEMLKHYNDNRQSEVVYVGTMTISEGNEAIIQWSELKDPLIF